MVQPLTPFSKLSKKTFAGGCGMAAVIENGKFYGPGAVVTAGLNCMIAAQTRVGESEMTYAVVFGAEPAATMFG